MAVTEPRLLGGSLPSVSQQQLRQLLLCSRRAHDVDVQQHVEVLLVKAFGRHIIHLYAVLDVLQLTRTDDSELVSGVVLDDGGGGSRVGLQVGDDLQEHLDVVDVLLQQSIVDTEDKIQASRRFYNGGVRELNTKIKVFPNNLFARNLGFTEREFFEVVDGAAIAEPPRVQF